MVTVASCLTVKWRNKPLSRSLYTRKLSGFKICWRNISMSPFVCQVSMAHRRCSGRRHYDSNSSDTELSEAEESRKSCIKRSKSAKELLSHLSCRSVNCWMFVCSVFFCTTSLQFPCNPVFCVFCQLENLLTALALMIILGCYLPKDCSKCFIIFVPYFVLGI